MKFYTLNDVRKKAKKQSDNSKNLGYFVKLNAGNVPFNNAMFNHMVGSGNVGEVVSASIADGGTGMVGQAMGENLSKSNNADKWVQIDLEAELGEEDIYSGEDGKSWVSKNSYNIDFWPTRKEAMMNGMRKFKKDKKFGVHWDVVNLNEDLKDIDFEPFFFENEDYDWLSDFTYYADRLNPTKYMDEYDNYEDFIDIELTAKVLGAPGNTQENEEVRKWFEINYPEKAKLATRLFKS